MKDRSERAAPPHSLLKELRSYSLLLVPGLSIKRWVLLVLAGFVGLALGLAYFLREVYEVYTFPPFVYYLTLQFLPRALRGALFVTAGAGAILIGLWQLNRTLLRALLQPGARDQNLIAVLYQQQQRRRGPKIVAIGGGTGLATLLRGIKEYTDNLTAIVTVADDGGSTGRLRREMGVLPPGDFRKCIAALAEVEPLMTQLFEYRFNGGTGLDGHSFGNLFIVALAGITGNFEKALQESSRVLAVRGRILPSTLANVTLWAQTEDEHLVEGESNIPQSGSRIHHVYLTPPAPPAHPEAVHAIEEADLIVLGPGSLYTSVVPNLLVPEIRAALQRSRALRVYVCNVAPQLGETEGYTVADHVNALLRHGGPGIIDCVLAHRSARDAVASREAVPDEGQYPDGIEVFFADVQDKLQPHFHDPHALAAQLLHLYEQLQKVPRLHAVPVQIERAS